MCEHTRSVRRLSDPPASAGLVVVGSGIVGAATAFFAARAGLDVVVARAPRADLRVHHRGGCRRLPPPARARGGAGAGAAGRSTCSSGFAEETGQSLHGPRIRRQGYLWLTREQSRTAVQRELVERQQGWGVDGVELLTGDETRARFPWVSEDVVQARFRWRRRADRAPEDRARSARGLRSGRRARLPRHRVRDVRRAAVRRRHRPGGRGMRAGGDRRRAAVRRRRRAGRRATCRSSPFAASGWCCGTRRPCRRTRR